MENNGKSGQIAPRLVVNPSQYEVNAAKIAELKRIVEDMEKQNETGYVRYQLEQRIREGMQAQEMLAKLTEAQATNQPVASSSASNVSHYSNPNMPVPLAEVEEYARVPTTAHIVEVTSPSQSTRATSRTSSGTTVPQSSHGSAASPSLTSYGLSASSSGTNQQIYGQQQPNGIQYGAHRVVPGYGQYQMQAGNNPASQTYGQSTAGASTSQWQAYAASSSSYGHGQPQVQHQTVNPMELYRRHLYNRQIQMQMQYGMAAQQHRAASGSNVDPNNRTSSSLSGALGQATAGGASATAPSRTVTPTATISSGPSLPSNRLNSHPNGATATAATSSTATPAHFTTELLARQLREAYAHDQQKSRRSAASSPIGVPNRMSAHPHAPDAGPKLVRPESAQSAQASQGNPTTAHAKLVTQQRPDHHIMSQSPKSSAASIANTAISFAQGAGAQAFNNNGEAATSDRSQQGNVPKPTVYYSYPGFPYQQYRYAPYHQYYGSTSTSTANQGNQRRAQMENAGALPSPSVAAAPGPAATNTLGHRVWVGSQTAPSIARPKSPLTPAKAEKRRLARDILRALGKPEWRELVDKRDIQTIGEASIVTNSATQAESREGEDGEDSEPEAPGQSTVLAEIDGSATVDSSLESGLTPQVIMASLEADAESASPSKVDDVKRSDQPGDLAIATQRSKSPRSRNAQPKRKWSPGLALHTDQGERKRQKVDGDVVEEERDTSQPPIAVLLDSPIAESETRDSQETDEGPVNQNVPKEPLAASPGIPESQLRSASTPRKLVSQSTFPAIHERTPLFLPSPVSSPSRRASTKDAAEPPLDTARGSSAQSSPTLRTLAPRKPRIVLDYVEVPPSPEWGSKKKAVKPDKSGSKRGEARSKKQSVRKLATGSAVTDSNLVIISDDESTSTGRRRVSVVELNGELEERAFVESASRLCARRCQWRSCDAVLNSVDNLLRHLLVVHLEEESDGTSPDGSVCLWKDCQKRSSDMMESDKHLEAHAALPIPCAYQGCDVTVGTVSELVQHNASKHREGRLKPEVDPFDPPLRQLESLEDVSKKLPSPLYSSFLSVSPCPISPSRHAQIGPWVLRRIFGPVNLQYAQYNAAAPLRPSHRLADQDADPKSVLARIENSRHDEYDFAKAFTLEPPDYCDDLPSAEVTDLVRNGGLVFWGPAEDDIDVKEEQEDRHVTQPSPPRRSPTQDGSHMPGEPDADAASSTSSDELRLRGHASMEQMTIASSGGNVFEAASLRPALWSDHDEEAVAMML
ncbi:hypothetical protein GLOTRDRAFT_135943 [Gloeophyllum trabeum ATCC 11539]|uniref:C2H2-type domain-containing protein n=1 Tax=Gloeophyllum trabeum (strain ATCC 11539 / FP-39264 / Madison 617) TaxID=670483 RepID=S7RZR9_GLOTA|nr:uncharacterized protein GLOTRDRAFT_135943 [Gloeophyllum trabeum ATCC 11539]EPQ58939.1 hypothetical protein GLOTRDRAFT_135943 [Gloeophyllum trabeum ATCC 11539]